MIRNCDGTDPNLTRDVREGELPQGSWPDSVPCDCGLTFDDVDHYTYYPHAQIPERLTDEEIERLMRSCLG